jgi:hypothetical protein
MSTIPKVDATMHNEIKGFYRLFFKREQRTWNKETHGEPCIHESVSKRTKNNDNKDIPVYSPWILKYKDKDNPCIEP